MGREIIPLSNGWLYKRIDNINNFNPKNNKDYIKVNIPHTNLEIPYNYFDEREYQFTSCYKRLFYIDKKNKNKKIFIDFDGVMDYAKVFVNSNFVGEHKGGYTPFSFDITEKVFFDKENLIYVIVDSTESSNIPPFGNVIDYLSYGGIYREVQLRIVEKIYIDDVVVRTIDILNNKKKIELFIFLKNNSKKEELLELDVELFFNKNKIKKISKKINLEKTIDNTFELEVSNLGNIQLWDIDYPNLYDLKINLKSEEMILDNYETKIGFRKAIFKKDGFYLNGEKIKLIGLNRHQSFPYVGYAIPKRVQEKDADILKNYLHLNMVRTSHYPQSRHFLNKCDEIGLLVFEEIPGWQHIGDEKWKNIAKKNIEEMIIRDRNHPSIILWGVRINESKDDHKFYLETNEIAHKLDPTRQTGGVRNLEKSEFLEDVYTMNDFIFEGNNIILREQKNVTGLNIDVPYLVTEFCGHMFPTKRFDNEQRLIEHARRHLEVQNEAGLRKNISGAIGWCMSDYNTHFQFGSGDRICYHGVLDMFRLPKFAAYFYRSQVSPEKEIILECLTYWARGEKDRLQLTPIYIFTNCDSIDFYTENKKYGSFYPEKEKYKGLKYPPVIINEIKNISFEEWDDCTFIGILNGKHVKKRKFSKNPIASKLQIIADDSFLKSDEIDATRIIINVTDQYENIMPYYNDWVKINISGPAEIIGPEQIILLSGSAAFWIKTKLKRGKIIISAKCSRFFSNKITIEVK